MFLSILIFIFVFVFITLTISIFIVMHIRMCLYVYIYRERESLSNYLYIYIHFFNRSFVCIILALEAAHWGFPRILTLLCHNQSLFKHLCGSFLAKERLRAESVK